MKKWLAQISIVSLIVTAVYAQNSTETFTLTSKSFADHANLPILYTCDGKNISPQLMWEGAPQKTQSFALIISDLDAPNGIFYHWILYNIPPNTHQLEEGIVKLPGTTQTGKNSFNKVQYDGPCPPKRSIHAYTFSLYALDTEIDLANGADANAVLNAMQNHILGKVDLNAVYGH